MTRHSPLREFDLFDPEPFLTLPPLLGRRLRSPAPVEEQQGREQAAATSIRDPGVAAAIDPPRNGEGDHAQHGGGVGAAIWASPALAFVVERRLRQIERFGHTPEQDAHRAIDFLPRLAVREANMALEDLTTIPGADTPEEAARLRAQRLRACRKKLADMCALGLAAIARLDAEPDQ